MKRLIQIIQVPELSPLPVMKQVFSELTPAFYDYDCNVHIIQSLEEIEDGGILFLDDAAGDYKKYRHIYDKINKLCPTGIYVCWYWRDTTFRPFEKMIYTGEYYINLHNASHETQQYMTLPKYVPLKLRANDPPGIIGIYRRNIIRDYCYMGGGYKMDWVKILNEKGFTGLYHRVLWDNYLSYNDRRRIYLSSTFALGFQSDENIKNGHLSQRIFEGLAYGCVVLCENVIAANYTDGAVVHVESEDDMAEKMKYYLAYPDEIVKKQQEGYKWIKEHGTNRHSVLLYLDFIYRQYREEFV
jgi:glycosyltransferase involved in cell wall biosynthesis